MEYPVGTRFIYIVYPRTIFEITAIEEDTYVGKDWRVRKEDFERLVQRKDYHLLSDEKLYFEYGIHSVCDLFDF